MILWMMVVVMGKSRPAVGEEGLLILFVVVCLYEHVRKFPSTKAVVFTRGWTMRIQSGGMLCIPKADVGMPMMHCLTQPVPKNIQ